MNLDFASKPVDKSADIIFPLTKSLDSNEADALIKKLTGVSVSSAIDKLKSDKGSIARIFAGERTIWLLSLGDDLSFKSVVALSRKFAVQNAGQLSESAVLILPGADSSISKSRMAEAIINGITLGTYKIGKFKSDAVEPHPFDTEDSVLTVIDSSESEEVKEASLRGKIMAEVQQRMMDLVNAPGNRKTPEDIATYVRKSAQDHGYEVKVRDKKWIQENRLLALEAVNRGSEYPPVFLEMSYSGNDNPDAPVYGLVGKGITFDTGGLSIKTSAGMYFMKSDMGGAAAVIGAVEAAAALGLKVNIECVVPLTDNLVDSKSIKPADVIGSYSGKTIEIVDTDAEGRLILADGLAWLIKNARPDHLIDLATLTGSAVRALGYEAAALFTNNDELSEKLEKAGSESGERLWRMPLWKEYRDDLNSDVADIKNLGSRPVGGAIAAAKFLESFIGDHDSWAHMDIAGVAFGDTDFGKSKNATAWGVRLLIDYLSNEE